MLDAERTGGSLVCPWENLQSKLGWLLAVGSQVLQRQSGLVSAVVLARGTARVPSRPTGAGPCPEEETGGACSHLGYKWPGEALTCAQPLPISAPMWGPSPEVAGARGEQCSGPG